MNTRLTLALVIMAVLASAQPMLAQDGSFAYTGTITGRDVYVRAGMGSNAYPVAKLSSPSQVTVVEQRGDWLKILPPPNVFSVISKDYVHAAANGVTGTVTGNRVRVRAGSDLVDLGGVTKHWAFQQFLNNGDQVTIVGQGQDFYKITPPDRARVWISAKYVARGGPAALPPTAPPRPPEPPTPARPPSGDSARATMPTADAIAAFRSAEEALKLEFEKPFKDRQLEPIVAQYEAVQVHPNTPLGRAVRSRITFLSDAVKQRRQWEATQEDVASVRRGQDEVTRRRRELSEEAAKPIPPRLAAQGVLRRSLIFRGGARPLRFILEDATQPRINAYIHCSSRHIDLVAFEGKEVGVYGQVNYGGLRGVDLVDVERLVLMTPEGEVDVPPEGPGELSPPGELPKLEDDAPPDVPTETDGPQLVEPDSTDVGTEGVPEPTPEVDPEAPTTEPDEVPAEADRPTEAEPDAPAETTDTPEELPTPEPPSADKDELDAPEKPDRPERIEFDRVPSESDETPGEIEFPEEPQPKPEPPARPETPAVVDDDDVKVIDASGDDDVRIVDEEEAEVEVEVPEAPEHPDVPAEVDTPEVSDVPDEPARPRRPRIIRPPVVEDEDPGSGGPEIVDEDEYQ